MIRTSPPSTATEASTTAATAAAAVDLSCDPFRPDGYADALGERGVTLAPLLVRWRYRLPEVTAFAQWLKTHEIILADARLVLTPETAGVHYFGTYIVQPLGAARIRPNEPAGDGVGAQSAVSAAIATAETQWGFSSQSALDRFYDLCSGRPVRLSIVEQDLRTFVSGLKSRIHEAGDAHFCQSVLLASAVYTRPAAWLAPQSEPGSGT